MSADDTTFTSDLPPDFQRDTCHLRRGEDAAARVITAIHARRQIFCPGANKSISGPTALKLLQGPPGDRDDIGKSRRIQNRPD
jgi:hypothetical protein